MVMMMSTFQLSELRANVFIICDLDFFLIIIIIV